MADVIRKYKMGFPDDAALSGAGNWHRKARR